MKKVLSVIISGILLLALSGCSIKVGIDKKRGGGESHFENSISVEGINTIRIDTSMAETVVSSYEGDEVKVTAKLSGRSKGIEAKNIGDLIEIKEDFFGGNFSLINSKYNDHSIIEILVPNKFNGNFYFNQGVGKTEVRNLNGNNISIKGGASTFEADEISFNKMDLEAGVGTVNISTKGKTGEISINGGVGDVKINLAEVGGNLVFKGGVGSGKITIPRNSPVAFKTKSGLGDCKVDAKTSGEDTYTFDLSVGVGEIKVTN